MLFRGAKSSLTLSPVVVTLIFKTKTHLLSFFDFLFNLGNPYLKRLLKSWEKKQKMVASDGGNAYGVNGDLVKNIIRQAWRLIWNQPTDKYSTDARSAVVPRFVGGTAAGDAR